MLRNKCDTLLNTATASTSHSHRGKGYCVSISVPHCRISRPHTREGWPSCGRQLTKGRETQTRPFWEVNDAMYMGGCMNMHLLPQHMERRIKTSVMGARRGCSPRPLLRHLPVPFSWALLSSFVGVDDKSSWRVCWQPGFGQEITGQTQMLQSTENK